ncbi:class I SAM-dependent methyltransferase [Christiangramia sediminis]|uniref:Class I SAM-dependent methyltransferase n=1 Tax=Christiangramia sediminis TaxID=2881336 RepID=A0A9X1LH23_9FLAO|nr:class I SAM-dependent methyltransferase [Christiangramia sediminis]MCB7480224.1 class I SAM-dependent methyltransferase [Christiangramia sediminis]
MLNKALLEPEVSRFIKENQKKDLPSLILKGSPFENVSVQELATQIKGLKVAEKKFPELYKNPDIIYPPKLNLEQSSSEITAKYKASLIDGKAGIDITGGLGIDTYFISKNFKNFSYCELNADLAEIAEHNFKVLHADNISVHNGDGLAILKSSEEKKDWVFADPARRDDHGGKVFKLEDCEPNIPKHLKMLFQHSDNLMVKSSPILDITAGIQELRFVKEIHIVAFRNEVKELLWILNKDLSGTPIIKTINFDRDKVEILSGKFESSQAEVQFSLPEAYLYEPNAAIMKCGLFDILAKNTSTKKLHQHSHLYTSDKLIDFPGRSFKILEVKDFKPGDLKSYFKSKKANITTRNFPESVESIRKKFKIKDGGSDYIFFTTNMREEKIVIVCKKV